MNPKFRAWDKIQKKMGVVISNNWMTGVANIIIDNKETLRQEQDYILMKSTGIKDKNGTEIFEGDVLEIQGLKMIVRFGSYNYIETSKSGTHTLGIMCDGLGFYVECLNIAAPDKISPFEPEALKAGKIIGNIHENQELLEVADDQ